MNPKTGEVANPDEINPQGEITPSPKVPEATNPRDMALAEIAKRAQARREKEEQALKFDVMHEDGSIEDAPVTPAAPEPTEPPNTEAAELAASSTPPPAKAESTPSPAPAASAQPEEERELIVDGQRIRVPISKIIDSGIRTLQKETTADMRLNAATELLRSAQERAQPAPAEQQAQPSDEDALLARQIQFGTEDEAKAAIARLRNAQPAITPQQIDAYVQKQLAVRLPEHQAFHEANAWLASEHTAITSDPELKFMFDLAEDRARKAGDRRPYKELYADIAGKMVTKFNLKKPDKQEPAQPFGQTTQASDRLQRKATSPRPVTGASGRLEQPQAPKRAPTVADYVEQQRQARGLQPLNKQTI